VKTPVVWTPEAEVDLAEARAWYDDIRSELGERFARAVDEAIESISVNPRRFRTVHRELRRAGVRRFPYGILFEVQENRIIVFACFHGRRDPRRWQKR
jgi:toxin ParE1/3/4